MPPLNNGRETSIGKGDKRNRRKTVRDDSQ